MRRKSKSSDGRSDSAPAGSPQAPVKPKPSLLEVLEFITSTAAIGMAIGTGENIPPHVLIAAASGPDKVRHETVPAAAAGQEPAAATTSSHSDACGDQNKAFQDCINSSGNDNSNCQFYMDMLSECKKGSGLAA